MEIRTSNYGEIEAEGSLLNLFMQGLIRGVIGQPGRLILRVKRGGDVSQALIRLTFNFWHAIINHQNNLINRIKSGILFLDWMINSMPDIRLNYEFLQYLVNRANATNGADQLPSLSVMSKEMGVSVAYLREQLEVAKAFGLVEARPRTGIRRLTFSFLPAVMQSASYAIAMQPDFFWQFSDLRIHIEAAYWNDAVHKLTSEDHQKLKYLVDQAWKKLRGHPIEIPHAEHRELHLTIYSRLGNPFVQGLLEAYWELYEAVGMNLYTDYNYLEQVWKYHQLMVDSICNEQTEKGFQALVEHKDLIYHRSDRVFKER